MRVHSRAAYILVGGKSSRFGSDKALIQIEGRPLAIHLADILEKVAQEVTLVGPPERYRHLGLPIIPDILPNEGPLPGILTALEQSEYDWNLIIACDMPLLTREFLEFLFAIAEESKAGAIVPVSPDGTVEPLCAVYAKRSKDAIREQIESGVRRITQALECIEVRQVMPAEYRHLDPEGRIFTNVNTLDDWELLK